MLSGSSLQTLVTTMPTSVPPRSGRGAARSIPPSPASSQYEGKGESSTFSVLSPSFHLTEQEEVVTPACREMSEHPRSEHPRSEHPRVKPTRIKMRHNQSPVSDLSPWEEWYLCKEKEIRARLQAQALEELNLQMAKQKEKEDRARKKIIAEAKHKEWVQKKNEEEKRERRERERMLSKEMAERAAKELKKQQIDEEAKDAYNEWIKRKRAEDVLRKREEKERERQLEAELQEKKERSDKMFKEWLQSARNKTRPASASCAYDSGKLTGYPSGNEYPAPSFYNPVPWKPIVVPSKEDKYVSVKKNKRPMSNHVYRSSSLLFHKSKNKLHIGSLCENQR